MGSEMMKTLLTLWRNVTPWTRRILIICTAVVIVVLLVCLAVTDNFNLFFSFLGEKAN